MKTLIYLILDRSGSMSGKENDVLGGVNSFLREQKKIEGAVDVTISIFADTTNRIRTSIPLSLVAELNPYEYQPRGNTALLDAIGAAISELDYSWGQVYPDKTIVVIVTDGEENCSKKFSKLDIQNKIRDREASGKWTFVYLGASPAAFHEARSIGISTLNTAQYADTGLGTQTAYSSASASVGALRGGAMNAGLGRVLDEVKN